MADSDTDMAPDDEMGQVAIVGDMEGYTPTTGLSASEDVMTAAAGVSDWASPIEATPMPDPVVMEAPPLPAGNPDNLGTLPSIEESVMPSHNIDSDDVRFSGLTQDNPGMPERIGPDAYNVMSDAQAEEIADGYWQRGPGGFATE